MLAVLTTAAVPTVSEDQLRLHRLESYHSFSCSASCSTSALLETSSKILAVLTTAASSYL